MRRDTEGDRRPSGWGALDRRQRHVLSSTLAANALLFFDQTAVTVALPAISRTFRAPSSQLQWTITAYLLALAVFMAVAGRLADHFGRRRLFLTGVAVFGLASATCAIAGDLGLLIGARFVQGMGGALIQPLALANTTTVVGEKQRGWAIGLLSTGGTTFLTLGPLIAGAILAVGSWRWLFVVNLPVVAFALAEGFRWMRPSREPNPTPIEVSGLVLLLLGLAATVMGITQLPEAASLGAVAVVGGIILLAAFVRHELRSAQPLIPFHFLRNRLLSASLVALFAIQFVVLGTSVCLVLFLQHGLGESAFTAGLVLALAGVFTPLLSPLTGRIADRRGPRTLVVTGLVLATTGLLWIGLAASTRNVALLVPGLLVFSLSRPAVFTPASVGPLLTLSADQRGFAASLVTEARQMGAVVGVATLVAVLGAVRGTSLTNDLATLARGFEVAMLVAAAVAGLAAIAVGAVMPRPNRART